MYDIETCVYNYLSNVFLKFEVVIFSWKINLNISLTSDSYFNKKEKILKILTNFENNKKNQLKLQ